MSANETGVSFEEKIAKAQEKLNELMKSDITLEKSLAAYESGMKEIEAAQKMLQEATLKVKGLENPPTMEG